MLKKINKLFAKLKLNTLLTIECYIVLREVVKLDTLKLSILHFLSKFINMVVMFLPIKIFLLLASSSSIEPLSILEGFLGRNEYVVLLLSVTAILYLINIFLQLYLARLLNKQHTQINLPEYNYGGRVFTKQVLSKIYRPCFLATAAFLMIFISSAVFLFLSIEFALVFISVLIFYLIFVEYFAFTDNKFKLLKRLNIDQNQLLTILSSVLYLLLFFAIFYIFTVFSLAVHNAILLLLLARLANASIKEFIINQQKLVNGFPHKS